VSDCEGPISLNDNAFELSGHFIPDGEKFFEIVSKYDDVLVDVVKREGYVAGSTLKLIAPFLKAYGANNKNIIKFSQENVLLLPGAKETLSFIPEILPSFIVSTSYEQYISALCKVSSFPFKNCYYTNLDLDRHEFGEGEEEKIRKFKNSIVTNPEFENLETIFWEEIPDMKINSLLDEINPVGGEAKKEAVEDIIHKHNYRPRDLIYFGDSITDVEPLRFANEKGGLGVSFNGNNFAIEEATLAVISNNTLIIDILAELFKREGTEDVIEFAQSYNHDPEKAFKTHSIDKNLTSALPSTYTRVDLITCNNIDAVKADSGEFRKKMRGEAIGGLG
jgi:energy-converting hydrogenase A subunit R